MKMALSRMPQCTHLIYEKTAKTTVSFKNCRFVFVFNIIYIDMYDEGQC